MTRTTFKFLCPLPVMVLLLLVSLSTCNRPHDGWKNISPAVDSLNRAMDRIYADGCIKRALPLLDRLNLIAERDSSNRILQANLAYWKIVWLAPQFPDSVERWRTILYSSTDSAEYPYLFQREALIDNTRVDKDNFLSHHKRLLNGISYFSNLNDTLMEMMATKYLSSFYAEIGDMDKYRDCAVRIHLLCESLGNDTITAKSMLNVALAEIHVGDSAKAEQILTDLLRNPVVSRDSIFIGRVFVNLGEVTGDPAYFQRAIEVSPLFRENTDNFNTLRFAMMRKYEMRGDYAKADSLFVILHPIAMTNGDLEARRFSHAILMRQAKERGDYVRAMDEADSVRELEKQAFSPTQYEQLISDTYQIELDRQLEEMKAQRRTSLLTTTVIITVFLLLVTVILLLFRRYRRKAALRHEINKLQLQEMEKEIDKEKAVSLAMSLSMAERDRLISQLTEIAHNSDSSAASGGEERDRRLQQLKLSQLSIAEWDDFQTAYSKVHPLFLKRLKEAFPDTTEGDSRLALYIAAGLSTKEIAKIMQLQPDSIKKNRQRLRQRMHISAEEDLEGVLRKLL